MLKRDPIFGRSFTLHPAQDGEHVIETDEGVKYRMSETLWFMVNDLGHRMEERRCSYLRVRIEQHNWVARTDLFLVE